MASSSFEYIAVSCPRMALPGAKMASPPSTALSGRLPMPEFSGLKIQFRPSRALVSLNSRTPGVLHRGGTIMCEAQNTAVEVPVVTDRTWKSLVLNANGPVLVEFWASWCGPCRMIHPVIDEIASDYAGKIQCFKLNTDDTPSVATQYGIRSIPTVLFFVNGEKKDVVLGAVPKTTLAASIEKLL